MKHTFILLILAVLLIGCKKKRPGDSAAKMYNKYGKAVVLPIIGAGTAKMMYNDEND